MIKIDNIKHFTSSFLSLISKTSESVCLKVDQDKIYSVTSSGDNTIVVFSTYKQQNDLQQSLKLNVPDINRLNRLFCCVNDNNVQIEHDSNCLKYKSKSVRFTYHLLEDGIITVPAVSIEKIKKLSFDHVFEISKTDVLSLIKGSSLMTDADKLYFYVQDGGVYAEITDKETQNTDSYTQLVCENFGDTEFKQMSINFEILRILSSLRFENVRVRINTDVNVLLFEVEIENIKHNFICTTYVR